MTKEIVKTSQFCFRQPSTKAPPCPSLCSGHTTTNHPPTAHCGLTLMGDQKKTIIQAYTSPGKNPQGNLRCQIHLRRPHTLTAVKVSKRIATQPCDFDTQLRATHPLLEPPLGSLEMQALTASPLHFERPQWLEHGRCSVATF